MPVSNGENKDVARRWIKEIDSTHVVVDIGAGVGTYKSLLTDTKAHWVGIEIFAPYITEYNLRDIYNTVICADARYLDFNLLGEIDLVIAGDVIEHMPRNDAIGLLDRLKQASKNIIISVPIVESHQGTVNGNEFETHHYQWDFDEMLGVLNFGANGKVVESLKGDVLGYYLWKKGE